MKKQDILNILDAWFISSVYDTEQFADQYLADHPIDKSEIPIIHQQVERSCDNCGWNVQEDCHNPTPCPLQSYPNWKPKEPKP